MREYIIATETSCDLPKSTTDEHSIRVFTMISILDGNVVTDFNSGEYYNKLREKSTSSTSAGRIADLEAFFQKIIDEGKDILYIGFSSALSCQFNNAALVANEMNERLGEERIKTIDTHAASAGEGFLVMTAAQNREKGMTLAENAEYIEKVKLKMCHWFTVSDLFYLKRGGRVSSVTALAGTLLNIKPVLHVDNEGRLINVCKAKGRIGAMREMCKRLKDTVDYSYGKTAYISHADCIEDANTLADMVRAETEIENVVICDIGPLIGAHSGPDTLALFFYGTER